MAMFGKKSLQNLMPALDQTFLITLLILPMIQFGLAKFSISITFDNGISPIWLSSGVYLAGVLLVGFQIWPAILFSELLINFLLFYPNNILISLLMSGLDFFEPLLAGFLITHFIPRRNFIAHSQDVFKLITILFISSFITATIGTVALCWSARLPWSNYSEFSRNWGISIMVGTLILTPTLLTWSEPPEDWQEVFGWKNIEFLCLLLATFMISRLVFGLEYDVEYMLIPLIIWSVFRFGQHLSTLLVVIISAFAIWGAVNNSSTLMEESISESLIVLQSFIGVIAITAYLLSAILQENKRATQQLKQINEELEQRVQERTAKLRHTLEELQQTQSHLLQSEKMSSLGQLVAGVAHEINNPVSFIHGNLIHAKTYTDDLMRLVKLYQQYYPQPTAAIEAEIDAIDLEFLMEDLTKLLQSMRMGTDRIREIVVSLRNFSRLDESEFKLVNIHEGIDSTLMILQNRFKVMPQYPAIEVIKEYGILPKIECYPGQLNQVFMNLLSNAIDAIGESYQKRTSAEINTNPGQIKIKTEPVSDNKIAIRISDNGIGVSEPVLAKLFDPFFTTKPVGKGTGLGLSISYQIITEKHQGQLTCTSKLGKGTEFLVEIPVRQKINHLLGF